MPAPLTGCRSAPREGLSSPMTVQPFGEALARIIHHPCGGMACKPVILSEAKDLAAEILRCAQDDRLTSGCMNNPG
jgi:hypothetical protein